MNKNCYELLEISPEISSEELKKVYHNLALKWHPDKWASKSEAERKVAEEKFKEISVAYKEILEERQNKLSLVKVDNLEEDAEKTKATEDTESEKIKEEKELIERELKWIDEIWENHISYKVISEEILAKIIEASHNHGVYIENLSHLYDPYGNVFEKLNSLSVEERVNFKNQLFAAIEEEIKKAKHKNDQSQFHGKSALEEFRKKAVEELDKMVKNFKEEFNLSTAKMSDLSKIRGAIAELNDWKKSSGNLGQNEKVFEQNSVAKNYLEELEKKEEELETSSEIASHSLHSQKEEQSTPEQSNQLNKQETEIKDQLQSMQGQLNQLQIQIKSLLASQNQNSTDQSNQFHQIQEQLNALQNQIQNWEKQDAPYILTSQSGKQKLVELKNQAQELQKSLQNKSQQEKEREKQQKTDIQPPKKEFNWLYVVIPMGAVIVGLLFLLLRKKEKQVKY